MQKYQISDPIKFDFTNIEGYIIPFVIDGKKMILKKFLDKTSLDNKVYTIKCLNKIRNLFDDRFILPDMLAYQDNVVGYTINYVDNINPYELLDEISKESLEKNS